MALTFQLHSSARLELNEAIDWYEKKRKGRGRRFFVAYLKILKAILANPNSFPIDFEEVRKANVPKFTYIIFFEVQENEVFVYAIFHQKREPESWKTRT